MGWRGRVQCAPPGVRASTFPVRLQRSSCSPPTSPAWRTSPTSPTPRTLPLFLAAQRERCGLLAQPDVLICGVGTRMYTPAPAAAASAVMEPPEPTPAAAAPEDAVTGQQCDWQWVEHKAWAEHVEGLVGSNGGSSGGSSDDLAAEDGEEGADWHIGQVTVAVQEVMQRLGPDRWAGWVGRVRARRTGRGAAMDSCPRACMATPRLARSFI